MQNLNDQDTWTRDFVAFLAAGWMVKTRTLHTEREGCGTQHPTPENSGVGLSLLYVNGGVIR
jgi:hypothetical protein